MSGGAHLHPFTRESQISSADQSAREILHLESRENGRSADGQRGSVALDTGLGEQGCWKGQQKPAWLNLTPGMGRSGPPGTTEAVQDSNNHRLSGD